VLNDDKYIPFLARVTSIAEGRIKSKIDSAKEEERGICWRGEPTPSEVCPGIWLPSNMSVVRCAVDGRNGVIKLFPRLRGCSSSIPRHLGHKVFQHCILWSVNVCRSTGTGIDTPGYTGIWVLVGARCGVNYSISELESRSMLRNLVMNTDVDASW
jgi:hypothetical protein